MVLTLKAMEWARDTGQLALFLKIDFDKACDNIDWSFITYMSICLGFRPLLLAMVNTLFILPVFVLVNNFLPPR